MTGVATTVAEAVVTADLSAELPWFGTGGSANAAIAELAEGPEEDSRAAWGSR